MRYKLTILNGCTAVFMIGLLVYTLSNYQSLQNEEGWGLAAMWGLAGLGLFGGFMDLLLQVLIRQDRTVNIIGSFVALTIGMVVALG